LQAGHADIVREQDGFTLIEIVCVLAIIAILAAIALPASPRATSRFQLEGLAFQTAALLNGDHNFAQLNSKEVATIIDAPARVVRSGISSRVVHLPSDVSIEAMLASRCNGHSVGSSILFLASGMSCGGVITLARPGTSFEVRVNWLTGETEVVPVR
jgi:general secretion pathway protein H